MGSVLSTTPFDLVDLLFDLEGLEVVEFGLVGLELGVELVLAGFFLSRQLENAHDDDADIIESKRPAAHSLVALKQNNPPTLVTSRQIVARVVELNGRYDIGCRKRSVRSARFDAITSGGETISQTFRYVLNIALVSEAPDRAC